VPISQPVDITFLGAAGIDLLAPRVIRMRADAVDCHDTKVGLSPTEQSLGVMDSYSTGDAGSASWASDGAS